MKPFSQSYCAPRPASQAMVALALAALTACGGGGDGPSSSQTTPGSNIDPPGTISGTVAVNGLVQNAVVCLDLNDNSACDPTDPTSAKTGSDGAYRLTYDTSTITPAQVAVASMISPQVPGLLSDPDTTIDTVDGQATAESARYVLRLLPGKRGQINPLTTLLAAGVAAGMTEALARVNIAQQLGIAESKIDDYQSDTALTESAFADNARTAAVVVAFTLDQGISLAVGDPSSAGLPEDPSDLRSLRYTDAANYNFSAFNRLARAAGAPRGSQLDVRDGRTGNTVIPASTLYNQAYLTPSGWRRCDDTQALTFTLGVPNRSVFCDVQESIGVRRNVSIAGRFMAEVVNEMQAEPDNTINVGQSTSNLVTALGMASFQGNSALRVGSSLNLNRPYYINSINTDGVNQTIATNLTELIAARPASAVVLPSPAGSLNLGLGSGNLRNLRVAFTGSTNATQGTVQFYECDLDATQTTASNCGTAGTGNYAISSVNGAQVMHFTGNAPTVMNHERVYVEVKAVTQVAQTLPVVGGGDWVFIARQNKPGIDSNVVDSRHLNGSAWADMKAQLGL